MCRDSGRGRSRNQGSRFRSESLSVSHAETGFPTVEDEALQHCRSALAPALAQVAPALAFAPASAASIVPAPAAFAVALAFASALALTPALAFVLLLLMLPLLL